MLVDRELKKSAREILVGRELKKKTPEKYSLAAS